MTSSDNSRELTRGLGASHATAVVVGTVIGSGIFLVPAEMMQAVGSAQLVYLAWIVGGLLSLFGAFTYAELGAMKSEAGGEYVYIRDAYGPLPAFLDAWTWFIIAKPASVASVTFGIVRVLGTFAVLGFLPHPISSPINVTWGQLLAIALTVLISALNYLGVRKAGDFQLIFTILKIGLVLVIGAAVFEAAHGNWGNFSTHYSGARGGLAGFFAALVAALWAYDGWNDLNMVAGEVRRPERNIPFALIAGMGVVAGLYMLTNAAVQYAMPATDIAQAQRPAALAMSLAVGNWGGALVAAGMALSMLVTVNGTIMSGARVPFAVARDGYFFRILADVHPRFHSPSAAIIVQAVLSCALLLVAQTFRELFSLAIFAEWLFYMVATSTVFVFRVREPNAPRPYRTWGYPVVPALFLLASAVLLYYTFTDNLRDSLAGTLVILAGVPLYLWFARKKQSAA